MPPHVLSLPSLARLAALSIIITLVATTASGMTFSIGPARQYQRPSQVAALVHDDDTIEIDAGLYTADVAIWRAHRLTFRGIGGLAHLEANGISAESKAIWVIKGNDCTVESIEFSGCRVPDHNGAGIRQEGTSLTVRHCHFHDNEDGILTGANANSDIVIESSEFAHNSYGDGLSHNIYIGHVRSFTFRASYSHHAHIGHNLKSRAATNYILYNRIMDEADGDSSYIIDLPNGGDSYVIGNLLQQGPNAENSTMLSYAAEGATNATQTLYLVNNTLVNDRPTGTFVRIAAAANPAVLTNNLFIGNGTILNGAGTQTTNRTGATADLIDRTAFDYHLTPTSPAINAGTPPGMADAIDLTPLAQYVHPTATKQRCTIGAIDIGAYEFGCPLATTPGDMNADGAVNLLDLPLFIAALLGLDPTHAPRADMNADAQTNGLDISLFTTALTTGR